MQAQFQSPQRVYFVLGWDSDMNWVIMKDKLMNLLAIKIQSSETWRVLSKY